MVRSLVYWITLAYLSCQQHFAYFPSFLSHAAQLTSSLASLEKATRIPVAVSNSNLCFPLCSALIRSRWRVNPSDLPAIVALLPWSCLINQRKSTNVNVQSVGATQPPGLTTKWMRSNLKWQKAPKFPSTSGEIERSHSIPVEIADACKSRLIHRLWKSMSWLKFFAWM